MGSFALFSELQNLLLHAHAPCFSVKVSCVPAACAPALAATFPDAFAPHPGPKTSGLPAWPGETPALKPDRPRHTETCTHSQQRPCTRSQPSIHTVQYKHSPQRRREGKWQEYLFYHSNARKRTPTRETEDREKEMRVNKEKQSQPLTTASSSIHNSANLSWCPTARPEGPDAAEASLKAHLGSFAASCLSSTFQFTIFKSFFKSGIYTLIPKEEFECLISVKV